MTNSNDKLKKILKIDSLIDNINTMLEVYSNGETTCEEIVEFLVEELADEIIDYLVNYKQLILKQQ